MTCRFMKMHPTMGLRCECCKRTIKIAPATADSPCVLLNGLEPGQDPDYSRAKDCEYYEEGGNFCGIVKIEPKKESLEKNVNHPSHYTQGGVECIDAIKAALTHEEFLGFLRGNVLKYAFRARIKNGYEDLKKADWYNSRLQREVSDYDGDEMWSEIKDHPGYFVSSYGRVRGVYGKIRKPVRIKNGYMTVMFSGPDGYKLEYVHRLVAAAFLLQEKGKCMVNHKDHDRGNNKASNLEWCTAAENVRDALSDKIVQIEPETGTLVAIYDSSREAEQALGMSHGNIDKCANGVYAQANGFVWVRFGRLIGEIKDSTKETKYGKR